MWSIYASDAKSSPDLSVGQIPYENINLTNYEPSLRN